MKTGGNSFVDYDTTAPAKFNNNNKYTQIYIWTYIQKISVYNNTTKTGKFGFKFQGLLVDIHFSKKQISHLDNIRASLQKQSSNNNNHKNNNIGITSELHAKVHGISE